MSKQRGIPHFRTLFECEGDRLLVGKPDHNGDWKWYPVIKIMHLGNHFSEREMQQDGIQTYNVTLQVVSPEAAGPENISRAFGYAGMSDEQLTELESNELAQVEALSEYGVFAPVWTGNGNNLRELLKQARREAQALRIMFGFYMDRYVNAIGSTGWDFVTGEIFPKGW